jgi:hypothetical protein
MGRLDGAPIHDDGLPSNAFYDYLQYESVVRTHAARPWAWSFSGTNGSRVRGAVQRVRLG